ncbi:hypothetical protein, conserved [Eimeria maxima]|uniref:Uncharacterized protein n=1 Tax=Eimeria maxima TaxID=5804 RepID=U6M3K5_EIMMA|nr:hypothetical protein, conserved [Eimeria maxima]CDJ58817.1 hypothetical protein, conserved [Eimeria maxima]
MENACSKRKPTTQLTKDQLQGEATQGEQQETETHLDMKEADADTLKNRRRLKIVRTHAPPAADCSQQRSLKEDAAESRLQTTPEVAPQTTESPATTAAAPPAATDGEQAAAPVAETANASEDAENGSSVSRTDGCAASADGAAAVEAADAAAAVHNGNAATGSGSSNGGGGGLFGSVLKGTSAFVSPFSSLGATGSSFLLPSTGATEGSSLFRGSGEAPAAEEDADVPPPEEPTVVTTTVDSKEEIIFSDKGEEEGLPNARILFFVNRTGRLRLNSPVLPSTVKFRHPVERSAASAAQEGGSAAKDLPLKKNTVEFTGLRIDAKDAKDTTFYRIRFSNDERAAEFISLANAKQEEAAKTAQNGSTN